MMRMVILKVTVLMDAGIKTNTNIKGAIKMLQPITMKAIEEKYGKRAKLDINSAKKWQKAGTKVYERELEKIGSYPQAQLVYKSTEDKYVIYNTTNCETSSFSAEFIEAIIGEVM